MTTVISDLQLLEDGSFVGMIKMVNEEMEATDSTHR
jgi:hypothetical protein